MASPRIIRLVHSTAGRTRLRLPWLHEQPDEAAAIADALAGLDPSLEVQVRPWTGSVLCTYDPDTLDEERIVAAARRHTNVAIVLRADESSPEAEAEYEASVLARGSSLTRAISEGFRDLNRSVMLGTEGRLDLGSLTGLGFLAVGAAEIAFTRKLPAPPWFNLAWWAFRTFTLFGRPGQDDRGDEAAGVEEADAGA